jgi:hypothetical protein
VNRAQTIALARWRRAQLVPKPRESFMGYWKKLAKAMPDVPVSTIEITYPAVSPSDAMRWAHVARKEADLNRLRRWWRKVQSPIVEES